MHHRHREQGQVAPLLALLAVGIGLACLGLGRFAGDAVDHARARTAADAAALAAAGTRSESEQEVARRFAEANGARIDSVEAAVGDVRVRVRIEGPHGDVTASARARALAADSGSGAGEAASSGGTGLASALRAALARAAQLLGEPVPITSGYRSPADQRRLWRNRATNRYPVAPPGASMHERGLAVDVSPATAERLAGVAARAGLCRPYPVTDPVHFELC